MPPKFGNPHLAVIVTNKCNLKCAYCLRKKSKAEIPLPKLEKIMKEAHQLGYRSMGLTGGEVLLYSQLKELFRVIKELKWNILFETNGILFNKEWLEFIEENTKGEISFSVSLDSDKKEEHEKMRKGTSFDKAVEAIRLIAKGGHNLRVTCVLSGENLAKKGDFSRFFSFVESLGAVNLNFQNEVDYKNRRQGKSLTPVYESLLGEIEKYKGKVVISPPGKEQADLLNCSRLEGKNFCLSATGIHPCIFAEPIKLGELKDFQDVYEKKMPAFIEFRKYALVKNQIKNGSCADCVNAIKKEIKSLLSSASV
jgi:MoaA/NifB/PqqE/SkfB family radical SAM enzyme